MYESLKIIHYPDPRLKQISVPVTRFDAELKQLALRMLELMRQEKGVGLAAPQVGRNIRMFVMNHTRELKDDRVYVNPVLSEAAGAEEGEEGCLSLPEINANILRSKTLKMQAQDLEGNPIEDLAESYIARIWQHETDHLNGILITDRMGPVARISARKQLKALEEQYAAEHPEVKKKKSRQRTL